MEAGGVPASAETALELERDARRSGDRMRRRAFIAFMAGVSLAGPGIVLAQEKIWRIGWLDPNPPPTSGKPSDSLDAFRSALGELGYVDGQ
jgi:hypothetical protein